MKSGNGAAENSHDVIDAELIVWYTEIRPPRSFGERGAGSPKAAPASF